MIRFVDLGFQVEPFSGGRRMFAWWCTIHDTFLCFHGDYAWASWEEFVKFRTLEPQIHPALLDRLRGLFPTTWKPDSIP